MGQTIGQLKNKANIMLQKKKKQAAGWLARHWFKMTLVALLAFVVTYKDINLQLNLSAAPNWETRIDSTGDYQGGLLHQVSQMNLGANFFGPFSKKRPSKKPNDDNLANEYGNMTYHNSEVTNVSTYNSKQSAKIKRQKAYVKRFLNVAKAEMEKFGIPASITLAQGLIESDAGHSRLASKNNNHFGIKCFSRRCAKGHCSNFTDDSHKDFFRLYATAWESYRAHSLMLNGKRYKHLKKLDVKDYKGWAHGLKKAGYATDKRYAEKLIHIIEELQLHQYDQ
ncbi:MAG: glucosaminidase domain-containing protein [Bacteroidota bacterium]